MDLRVQLLLRIIDTARLKFSVVVPEESPYNFEDPQGPIHKSLSLSLNHKVLENCRGLCILQTVS